MKNSKTPKSSKKRTIDEISNEVMQIEISANSEESKEVLSQLLLSQQQSQSNSIKSEIKINTNQNEVANLISNSVCSSDDESSQSFQKLVFSKDSSKNKPTLSKVVAKK